MNFLLVVSGNWISGAWWRCTDVASRVVAAIKLDHDDDPCWSDGPPYAVVEHTLDETDLEACSVKKYEDFDGIPVVMTRLQQASALFLRDRSTGWFRFWNPTCGTRGFGSCTAATSLPVWSARIEERRCCSARATWRAM